MRVLEVTESFATGTMEVVRTISEHAERSGHDVAIAYGERPETPDALRDVVAEPVELIGLPWTGRTIAVQMRAMHALRRLCRDWSPDVIHLHSSFAGFVGSLSIGSFAPTVYTPHGYSFLSARSPLVRSGYRVAERVTARRVSMVGAVSAVEARLARGVGARRVEVVPNGIPEFDRPIRHAERSDPPLVVAMGRIVAARQPLATARILHGVTDVAEVLWIGGPGPNQDEARAVEEMGIPVTGWLERDEAVRRLASATVLLNWSAWDSHPLAVLEALASDVLVIGSDIDANRELLGGSPVCMTEDDALRVLRDVLTVPGRLAEMLERQRGRGADFGAARMGERWLRIYAQLAAEPADIAGVRSTVGPGGSRPRGGETTT